MTYHVERCPKCSGPKFRDSRPVCFSCSSGLSREARRAATTARRLDDAVRAESAPSYVRNDPEALARWLAEAP
jgi:hypothetical protein